MLSYTRDKIRKVAKLSEKITHWIGSGSSIIVHTIFFIGIFSLRYFNYTTEEILLILTTAVSLEAIYLAIFIQMTVNRNTADIEDIVEDVQELGEDVEEISEEVEDIGEDIEEISEDIEELQEDEEEETEEEKRQRQVTFEKLEISLQKLLSDVEALKQEIRKGD